MPDLLARRKLHKGEICKKLQLKLAIKEYEYAMGALTLRKVATSYGISRTIMQARTASCRDFDNYYKDQQLLSPGEEQSIVDSIETMHSWGWLYRLFEVKQLARKILLNRMSVVPEISSNWVKRFLPHHLKLESRFTTPKDKN